jgi:non-ribosomal peptide synthetase component F
MSQCSFDAHVWEIIGTLFIGAQLTMLRPDGNSDFEYLAETCRRNEITYMLTVPSVHTAFFTFLKCSRHAVYMKYLRSVCSGGEPILAPNCLSIVLIIGL